MQNYRKILLSLSLALSLVACGSKAEEKKKEEEQSATSCIMAGCNKTLSEIEKAEQEKKEEEKKEQEKKEEEKKAESEKSSKETIKKETQVASNPKASSNSNVNNNSKQESPKKEEPKQSAQSNNNQYSNMRNNSILTSNGLYLPIINSNSQARADSLRKEILNWNCNYKTVDSNVSYYLALHRYPYGTKTVSANSLVFKDPNGRTRTYYKVYTSPVFPYLDGQSGPGLAFYNKVSNNYYGNAIAIQTCVNGNANFRVTIYKPR